MNAGPTTWLTAIIVSGFVFVFLCMPIVAVVMMSMTEDSFGSWVIVLSVTSSLLVGCSWLSYRIKRAGK